MRFSDAVYFAARERTEQEMAVAASSLAAAEAHRGLAARYRDLIDTIALAPKNPSLQPTSCGCVVLATQTITASFVRPPRSRADNDPRETTERTSQCRIDKRSDDRGSPVYIIMKDGVDVTSRWTRADADDELKSRNALQ